MRAAEGTSESVLRIGALPGVGQRASAVPIDELRATRFDVPFHVGTLFDPLQRLCVVEQLANVLVCRGTRTGESRGETERNDDDGLEHEVLVSSGWVVERMASTIAGEPRIPFTPSSRIDTGSLGPRKKRGGWAGPVSIKTHPKGEETCDLQRPSMVVSVTNAGHAGITRW